MRVAVHAPAGEVVGAVVLRARSLADIREVAELVHARDKREEGAAEGPAVRLLVEPAVLHALREGVGEHGRAGALRPGFRIAYELRPHAVLALLLEERLHHLAVAFEDARTVLAVGGEVLERHRHRGGHPAVAAPPHVGHVRRMVEETVRELQLVEVEDELLRGAVDVLPVAREAVRLRLEGGDHVGVVDPEARLVGVALLPPGKARLVGRLVVPWRGIVGLRLLPLHVRVREAEVPRALLAREDGDLQRHRAHDGEVDVLELRQHVPLRAVVGFERGDELLLQLRVADDARAFHRVDPEAHHGVLDLLAEPVTAVPAVAVRGAIVVGRRGEELPRDAAAHVRRPAVHRPSREGIRHRHVRTKRHAGERQQPECVFHHLLPYRYLASLTAEVSCRYRNSSSVPAERCSTVTDTGSPSDVLPQMS